MSKDTPLGPFKIRKPTSINELTGLPSLMSDMTNEVTHKLLHKKEEALRAALAHRGAAHLMDNIENKRFPKIAKVMYDGVEYYFVDDDTEKGLFIIGFELVPPTLPEPSSDYAWSLTYTMKIHTDCPSVLKNKF